MSLLARMSRELRSPPPADVAFSGPGFERRRVEAPPGDVAASVPVWASGPPLTLPGGGELARWASSIAGDDRDLPVIVLDCETTGLGWGQNVPFVIGVAMATGRHWCVEQWVLDDHAGEVTMLRDLAAWLEARGPARLVTFNGASFDLPVLRSRGVRCGVELSALEGEHLDALHVSRRLWRERVPDCRLTTLERWLLGQVRVGDIPSSEIPLVFQEHLERRDADTQARMDAVCHHNAADLLALAALLPAIRSGLEHPGALAEALGAARHLLATDRETAALMRLGEALEPESVWREAPAEILHGAGALLARLQRRAGDDAASGATWSRLVRRFPGDPQVHEGYAKHLEHRLGAPRRALEVALRSRMPCPRRVARLERKLGV